MTGAALWKRQSHHMRRSRPYLLNNRKACPLVCIQYYYDYTIMESKSIIISKGPLIILCLLSMIWQFWKKKIMLTTGRNKNK
jgi:hypothetical protein